MTAELTREQAAAAVAAAVAERDTIQQNLLELDGSFGKRLLAGAKLAGQTKQRWDAAAADLAALWNTFTAYSAVVDRAAAAAPVGRRPPGPVLAEITTLLTGRSVRLARASSALARGDLTGSGETLVSMAAAVQDMRRAFAGVADVTSAAETVWNAVADQLQQAGADLAGARQRAGAAGDDVLAEALSRAEAELGQLRGLVSSDPLALWHGGSVDDSLLRRLREHASAAVARADELGALRDNADRRIVAAAAAVSAAQDAWQDATAVRDRAAARIAGAVPTVPDAGGLPGRLAALDMLKATGRWSRLASELNEIEQQSAAVATACRVAEREAAALLDRRDELRGLLDGYRAKAARLGAAENSDLDVRYWRAHGLLWAAPCDLAAAAEAVTGYQQAVLELSRRERRP